MEGVVFDLDGTLVDSLQDLTEALGDVLSAEGRRRPTSDEVRAMVGDGARQLVQRGLVATGGAGDDADVGRLVDAFLATYGARVTRHTRPFDGIPAVLDAFAARGLPMAICTNKPRHHTVAILASTGLDRYFRGVVAGDDVPRKKPDPAHVIAACRTLGLPASRCAMVGDGHHDLDAARAAGAYAIGVRWGYGRVDGVPSDRLVERPAQLLEAW